MCTFHDREFESCFHGENRTLRCQTLVNALMDFCGDEWHRVRKRNREKYKHTKVIVVVKESG